MLNKFGQTDRDRLTAGVFERARAAGVGYLDDAAPDYPSARRATPSSEYSTEGMPSARGALTGRAEDLVHGFENSLQVRPVAQREQRLRLAPSPRVATLIAVFMLVCGLLVVGWQVLAAPPRLRLPGCCPGTPRENRIPKQAVPPDRGRRWQLWRENLEQQGSERTVVLPHRALPRIYIFLAQTAPKWWFTWQER